MASHRKPVVVGIDGSATAQQAVRQAARRASRDGAPLRIVHMYERPLGLPPGLTEEESILNVLRREGIRRLDEARDVATTVAPGLEVDTDLAALPVRTGLLRESEHASVLFLGNRGHSPLTGLLVGSTALGLAGHAHCPVVLTRGGTEVTPRTGPVAVGVDGTRASEAALAFAFVEAAAEDATLVAVHAYAESVFDTLIPGVEMDLDWRRQRELAEETIGERLAGWQEKYPQVRVEREVVRDRPTRALRRCAQTARLVVVGRRGRGGFHDLVLGSTSQQLLHHATCPVAVVPKETIG